MNKTKTTQSTTVKQVDTPLSLLQLFAKGRFTEAEIMLRQNPKLREVLLHLPGLRHTPFFKKRIRFYKHFAKSNNMVKKLREDEKSQMRQAFIESHCMTTAMKKAAEKAHQLIEDSYDIAAFTTRISRIRFNQMMRKRRQKKRAFL